MQALLNRARRSACELALVAHVLAGAKEIGYYMQIDKERRVDWVDLTKQPERLQSAGIECAFQFSLHPRLCTTAH